jgi:branched-chain amino acid transport system substrate-binding protein
MRRPRRLAHVVAVALALGATGCAGSKNNAVSTPLHVVRIGVIAPLEGAQRSEGRAIRNSVQLAVNDANARLAIAGWSIEVVAKNDASDPATGAQDAAALAADPNVIGVVGTYDSAVAWQVAPVLNQAGIAMISPANTDPSLTLGADEAHPRRQFATYFRLVANNAREGPALARYAHERLHARTAAVVSVSLPANRDVADGFAAAFRAAGGRVVFDTTVADNTTRMRDVAESIARRDPDVVFFSGKDRSAAALRSDAQTSAPLLGTDAILDDAYLNATDDSADGDVAIVAGPVATAKAAALYRLEYAAARFADPPTPLAPYAYDATNLLVDAAARALLSHASITADVRDEIVQNVQRAHVDGAGGPIAFDRNGDNTAAALSAYRVTNGAWTAVLAEQSG